VHAERSDTAGPPETGRARAWIRAGLILFGAGLLAAAWKFGPLESYVDPERLAGWVEPWRQAWFAGPLVLLAYVVLGLVLVPLLLMVAVTGIVFGPWWGGGLALAGSLASGAAGFGLGRWLGKPSVDRLLGARARRIADRIGRNGILAVFLARKIPAPYTLVNIVMGASSIRFRDFMIGTFLGLGSLVVVLAAAAHQAVVADEPASLGAWIAGALLIGVPFIAAWWLNRRARRSLTAGGTGP
jgi:phospholipase D1/2